MAKAIGMRLVRMVAVLWVVSIATFSLIAFMPGDPVRAILGQSATQDQVDHVRGELGLDRPVLERYVDWVGGMFQGDFGQTLVRPIQPVQELLTSALPVTLQLAVMAIIIGLAGGLLLGCIAAYRPGSLVDRLISSGSFALISIPPFVMALVLIRLFVFDSDSTKTVLLAAGVVVSVAIVISKLRSRQAWWASATGWLAVLWPAVVALAIYLLLPQFPREGWVRPGEGLGLNLKHAALPAFTMSLTLIPLYAQLLRTDMIATLRQNFITVSRAKGMPPRHVVIKEALRPSMFSLITVAGISFGNLVGGSVIVESIFGLPGLGRMLVTGIQTQDFAVVQVSVLVVAAMFLLLNTLVDITYSFLDPRLRRAGH